MADGRRYAVSVITVKWGEMEMERRRKVDLIARLIYVSLNDGNWMRNSVVVASLNGMCRTDCPGRVNGDG